VYGIDVQQRMSILNRTSLRQRITLITSG